MDTRTPKAASSKTSSLRTARHSYVQPSPDALAVEGSASAWHGPLISRDGPSKDKRYPTEYGSRSEHASQFASPSPPAQTAPSRCLDFPEELAQMIITMQAGQYNEQLAEAYREASDIPPVTKQSLSELDIHHIITNSRLRHDINFDRNLSFRPNLDGPKGHQKRQATGQYWKALEAELELYVRLFQGTPPPRFQDSSRWAGLIQNAQRRIPVMFRTIQEVLKSLVPDRDHARVDEHLDVPMLMQEIERGVCDLVRLAEWMAQLLKEHCAPMRDSQVDGMVNTIRSGVTERSSAQIVEGLRDLFGILETMKLDVANHQIRNLKTLLVEDTVNFEKHHHLDRLVSHRSRVNIHAAQAWYLRAAWEFAETHPTQPRNIQQAQLEIFVRAVVAQFFNRSTHSEFPETFYLDQDRLRSLKAEIEDLVCMEVCMDAFAAFLKQFSYDSYISPQIRLQLHSSLLAIMGSSMGYGSHQWVMNCEALSLEILRQASIVAGQPQTFSHDALSHANEHLLHMFYDSFNTHNSRMEATLLNRVITCTERNTKTMAIDLFNNLVPITSSSPQPKPTPFSHLTSSAVHTLNPETARWQDIANRVTHIIILHWRVWDRIAYVQEDGSERSTSPAGHESTSSSQHPVQSSQNSMQASEHESQLVTAMKTGDSIESGQEALVPHHTSSQ
ncbi:hypothetical protein SNOG_05381 [Parastagonospora nodorum SN15]|nr:hypothetical protein SNOG_05381 [Parastagonospora nodorum SN15]EAT87772.1 hypothetical protein SNOG_05381 [Parastagonospora nodorum SN15]